MKTKNFKEAIRALIRVKNRAKTSPYKLDIDLYGEKEIAEIEKAINEYKEASKKFDEYYANVPSSVYEIINILKFPSEIIYENDVAVDLVEKIEKMEEEIQKQIAEMTYEFVDEDDILY